MTTLADFYFENVNKENPMLWKASGHLIDAASILFTVGLNELCFKNENIHEFLNELDSVLLKVSLLVSMIHKVAMGELNGNDLKGRGEGIEEEINSLLRKQAELIQGDLLEGNE